MLKGQFFNFSLVKEFVVMGHFPHWSTASVRGFQFGLWPKPFRVNGNRESAPIPHSQLPLGIWGHTVFMCLPHGWALVTININNWQKPQQASNMTSMMWGVGTFMLLLHLSENDVLTKTGPTKASPGTVNWTCGKKVPGEAWGRIHDKNSSGRKNPLEMFNVVFFLHSFMNQIIADHCVLKST